MKEYILKSLREVKKSIESQLDEAVEQNASLDYINQLLDNLIEVNKLIANVIKSINEENKP